MINIRYHPDACVFLMFEMYSMWGWGYGGERRLAKGYRYTSDRLIRLVEVNPSEILNFKPMLTIAWSFAFRYLIVVRLARTT
ncbi:hypothetical protein MKW98_006528 [Papaver atlanticum]|uniref:Uncharacterized protein n=1 Tax=Papaver atlanticum TaxID=357466 RepID=A0AAD4T6R1_9MAGN|nr:hypothetical protein MKW98_006528 [Papaver atlanticum]